jgi:hypothetical protein
MPLSAKKVTYQAIQQVTTDSDQTPSLIEEDDQFMKLFNFPGLFGYRLAFMRGYYRGNDWIRKAVGGYA